MYTLDNYQKYEILFVFKTTTNANFKYYEYINCSEDELSYFVENCNKLSLYKSNTELNINDKFITLSTCEYSNQNGRLVIVAKQIS